MPALVNKALSSQEDQHTLQIPILKSLGQSQDLRLSSAQAKTYWIESVLGN